MAQIVINEISQNYTYNIGNNSYACVAMPITSCWGDGFFDPATMGMTMDEMVEYATWRRFPATQSGLESFVATYRGPASNYRLAKDYSYQMAMTLLTSGYDVLVCRLCPGAKGQATFTETTTNATVVITAKYPGSFANSLYVELRRILSNTKTYWNLITYVKDATGVKTAVENKTFVFEVENSNDNILHWSEVESDYLTISVNGNIQDKQTTKFGPTGTSWYVTLSGGTDKAADEVTDPTVSDTSLVPTADVKYVTGYRAYVAGTDAGKVRYNYADNAYTVADDGGFVASRFRLKADGDTTLYAHTANTNTAFVVDAEGDYAECSESEQINESNYEAAYDLAKSRYASNIACSFSAYEDALEFMQYSTDSAALSNLKYTEWLYTMAVGTSTFDGVYSLLTDKLTYNPNRIISPGWDDQNINAISDGEVVAEISAISPMHARLMEVAYYSRCATAYIDIPQSVERKDVWDETPADPGYAQILSRFSSGANDINSVLFSSHSALFAPWGQYIYVGTARQATCSPSMMALLIQRAQILNQALQYEWALPTNRKHNLNIGKLAYNVPKKLLDEWQSLEGVGVNVITTIPDLGTNIWGNSTLYEVPPATYQALANLSTRFLVNAVEDVAYRCGISITFQYNNDQAYNKFYAGVTPLLDTMKNVGAIDDYYVTMAADLNGLDQVNANTIIGKIYLVINGVVNDIYIDLIALPPSVDLGSIIRD